MNSKTSPNLFFNLKPVINLQTAQQLTQAALNTARKLQVDVVICVVDAQGNMVSYARMDNAPVVSYAFAQKKAFTATALRRSSADFAELMQPEQRLYGMQHSDERLLGVGGGLPIFCQGQLIGGIGVSGGLIAQDIEIAQSALFTCQLLAC